MITGSTLKRRITFNRPTDGIGFTHSVSTSICADRNGARPSGGHSNTFPSDPFKAADFADFEVKIGEDSIQSFQMHYADIQYLLDAELYIAHSPEVQRCLRQLNGHKYASLDASNADMDEEVYGSRTPASEKHAYPDIPLYAQFRRKFQSQFLEKWNTLATHPTNLQFTTSLDGVPSPFLLAVASASVTEVVFPMSQPIISLEPIDDSIERMISLYDPYTGEERPDVDLTPGPMLDCRGKRS